MTDAMRDDTDCRFCGFFACIDDWGCKCRLQVKLTAAEKEIAAWEVTAREYDEIEAERDALRAQLAREQAGAAVMRESVVRYVNAQGLHLPPQWKEHLVECCQLAVDEGNPYRPVIVPDAGAATVERMARLERVYAIAKQYHDFWRCGSMRDFHDKIETACAAVAELDAATKEKP